MTGCGRFTVAQPGFVVSLRPVITRRFNSDNASTHWIATITGQRCVRMASDPQSEGYHFVVLDFIYAVECEKDAVVVEGVEKSGRERHGRGSRRQSPRSGKIRKIRCCIRF